MPCRSSLARSFWAFPSISFFDDIDYSRADLTVEAGAQPLATTYTVIRKTWLSRKLPLWAPLLAAISTFILVVGGVWYSHGQAEWMSASPAQVFGQNQIWRIWTTLFAHGDEKHLLSNSFYFFIMATFLSGYFGLLTFPIAAFVMGGAINLITLFFMNEKATLIGASGAVFWMGGVWLTLYFLLDRRRNLFQRSLRSLGVALLMFFPSEAFDPTISYRAHFVGFVLGVAWGLVVFFSRQHEFRAAEVRELIVEEPEATFPEIKVNKAQVPP